MSALLAGAPLITGAQVLAAGTDDKDRASPIGLFVVLALCVAVYFLWKSMNRHLKKLPESFDAAAPIPGQRTELPDEPGASAPAEVPMHKSEPPPAGTGPAQ